MKINITNILIIVLVILVLIIGYGVFKTNKIEYSPQLIKSEMIINELNKDKKSLYSQIDFLQKEYSDLNIELKNKNRQIQNKEIEIKNLKKVLNEKIDSINKLDEFGNFSLFSSWISKDN